MIRFIFLLLVLLPSIAFAADVTAANPMGDALGNLLESVVFPILGPFLLGLATLLLNILRKKLNLQISADTEAMLLGQAKNAISYAEEKAADIAKRKVSGWEGPPKLQVAVTHLMASAPKISQESADRLVHAALGMTEGAGATGDKAVK